MGDALIDEAMLDHASKAFEGFGGGTWEPAWRNTMWAVLRALQPASADRIAELEALLDEAGKGETGWLIEDQNEPQWLTLKPAEALWSMVFTKDSIEALRFPRRVDAEDYIRTHLDDAPVCITEHSWPSIQARTVADRIGRAGE